jgi:ubiquinone/menaquinone biosynthesis C-methylase UbiE
MRHPGLRRARSASRHSIERYYEARASEYDATTYRLARDDPATAADLVVLEALVAGLPPARVLDVGCGSGWMTRLLRGRVVGLDSSVSMLRLARARVPGAVFVHTSAPPLPFLERSFERVFASHFYSHLVQATARRSLVAEALRVAGELIVVEQTCVPDVPSEAWERRVLRDGSVHRVYKRYLPASALADELGGDVILDKPSFVAVRATSG